MKKLFLWLYGSRFALFNSLILGIYGLAAIFLLIGILANNAPSDLKTKTGTVAKINRYDADSFLDKVTNTYSHFIVSFTDESSFEATGELYKNIDKTLFSKLAVGDKLTVTYLQRGPGASNRIYGLEYNGVIYMDKNAVSPPHDQYNRMITYITILAVATGVAVVLVIVNYFVNKKKSKIPNNAPHS